jgi:AcrR family transcriptional regulator
MSRASTKIEPVRESARQVRERLLEAGRAAFAAKGLGASLREDILAASGVSAGSFYHQFEGKTELLLEIVERDAEDVGAALAAGAVMLPDEDLMTAGKRLLSVFFDMADERSEFLQIYVREYYSDDPRVRQAIRRYGDVTIDRLARIYDPMKEAGIDVDTDTLATIVVSAVIALINYYLAAPEEERSASRERLIDGTIKLILGGFMSLKPIDEIH